MSKYPRNRYLLPALFDDMFEWNDVDCNKYADYSFYDVTTKTPITYKGVVVPSGTKFNSAYFDVDCCKVNFYSTDADEKANLSIDLKITAVIENQ